MSALMASSACYLREASDDTSAAEAAIFRECGLRAHIGVSRRWSFKHGTHETVTVMVEPSGSAAPPTQAIEDIVKQTFRSHVDRVIVQQTPPAVQAIEDTVKRTVHSLVDW